MEHSRVESWYLAPRKNTKGLHRSRLTHAVLEAGVQLRQRLGREMPERLSGSGLFRWLTRPQPLEQEWGDGVDAEPSERHARGCPDVGVGVAQVMRQGCTGGFLEQPRPERSAPDRGIRVLQKIREFRRQPFGKATKDAFDPHGTRVGSESREQHRLQGPWSDGGGQGGGGAKETLCLVIFLVGRRVDQGAQMGGDVGSLGRELRAEARQHRGRIGVQVENDRQGEQQLVPKTALPNPGEQPEQWLERVGCCDATQGMHGGFGQHGIGNELHERPNRLRLSDLAQSDDRGELDP